MVSSTLLLGLAAVSGLVHTYPIHSIENISHGTFTELVSRSPEPRLRIPYKNNNIQSWLQPFLKRIRQKIPNQGDINDWINNAITNGVGNNDGQDQNGKKHADKHHDDDDDNDDDHQHNHSSAKGSPLSIYNSNSNNVQATPVVVPVSAFPTSFPNPTSTVIVFPVPTKPASSTPTPTSSDTGSEDNAPAQQDNTASDTPTPTIAPIIFPDPTSVTPSPTMTVHETDLTDDTPTPAPSSNVNPLNGESWFSGLNSILDLINSADEIVPGSH